MNKLSETGRIEPAGSHFRLISIILVLCTILGLFAIRASAPHNFLDKDQERPVSYMLDAARNGHWICQTDWMNDVTSKPPMLTWIGALFILLFGPSPITFYIPSALAMALLAILIYRHGTRVFDEEAGLFAALFFLLSPLSMRLFILLRTDALFAFFVGVTAFAAYRAWTAKTGWMVFWALAAAATLTKGPLGLVLAASGLLAVLWERNSASRPSLKGNHLAGVLLYLLLTLGWFGLAYLQLGDALIDKIIRRELVAHAVDIGEADPLVIRIFKPTIYFIHRVLPWSLLTLPALWRVFRHPSEDATTRRFERFLTCWFLAGLAIFSVTQHQRGDLLAPILAPAMLLAGREAARLTSRLKADRPIQLAFLLVIVGLAQSAWYYHTVEPATERVRHTQCIRSFASDLKESLGADFPFAYVDTPYTLQLYLGTMTQMISIEEAAKRLAGSEDTWIAMSEQNAMRLIEFLESKGRMPFEVARCADGEITLFVILGNRPLPVNLPAG